MRRRQGTAIAKDGGREVKSRLELSANHVNEPGIRGARDVLAWHSDREVVVEIAVEVPRRERRAEFVAGLLGTDVGSDAEIALIEDERHGREP